MSRHRGRPMAPWKPSVPPPSFNDRFGRTFVLHLTAPLARRIRTEFAAQLASANPDTGLGIGEQREAFVDVLWELVSLASKSKHAVDRFSFGEALNPETLEAASIAMRLAADRLHSHVRSGRGGRGRKR